MNEDYKNLPVEQDAALQGKPLTLREKIFTYLSDLSVEEEWFEVPLDRNALAAYLFCDRSALCRELSKMKKDGVIDFHKNRFRILLSGIPKSD